MSKNISDPQKTFQRFPQESRRHKPEQSTGKHEYQQTDVCNQIQTLLLQFTTAIRNALRKQLHENVM